MTALKLLLCITAGCFIASPLYADIYEWTDVDGVTHYTNYAPPPEAKILMKTEELPYDEAADLARLEAEREERLELARLELVEMKADLERREAETEQRLAEASRQAEEALREAEKIRDDSYSDRNYGYSNYYRGYYPYHYKNRYYYSNETGRIHFNKPRHKDHFKRYRNKKHYYGYVKKHHPRKYNGQKYLYKKAHRRNYGHRSPNRYYRGQFSLRSHSSSHMSRGPSGRVHSVSRSRRN